MGSKKMTIFDEGSIRAELGNVSDYSISDSDTIIVSYTRDNDQKVIVGYKKWTSFVIVEEADK